MNIYYYSPNENGFMPGNEKGKYVNAGTWPGDAVEVDEATFATFTQTPPEGKMLGAIDGLPAWVDLPLPTREEAIAAAEQKKSELLIAAQATIINWQSKLLLGVISDDEKTSLLAWLAYIDALNAVDTANPNWPAHPEE
ncbi:tail fiber assembly protein [Citrobacter farmeri]|nr:tail fiber assembly protein [Citrobacter farmeri]